MLPVTTAPASAAASRSQARLGLVHRLGVAERFVGEAAGERLGQDDQIGRALEFANLRAIVLAVARRVVPAGIALNEERRSGSMGCDMVDYLISG